MSNPMPLYERYAKGTEWQLSLPVGGHPAGTRVRVEVEPTEQPDRDELVVVVTRPDTEETFVCDLVVLA